MRPRIQNVKKLITLQLVYSSLGGYNDGRYIYKERKVESRSRDF